MASLNKSYFPGFWKRLLGVYFHWLLVIYSAVHNRDLYTFPYTFHEVHCVLVSQFMIIERVSMTWMRNSQLQVCLHGNSLAKQIIYIYIYNLFSQRIAMQTNLQL